MLVSNILRITNKDESIIYGKELVRNEKDFYDILATYMGYEVASWFENYCNNSKEKIYELEEQIEELYRLP